jgi:DNA gyrase subunit B
MSEDAPSPEGEVENESATTTTSRKKKPEIQRYKGLGEMSAEQLWDTTMNPATRVLYKVTVGEAELANRIFEELMGDDVAPRRHFIQSNAIYAEVDSM